MSINLDKYKIRIKSVERVYLPDIHMQYSPNSEMLKYFFYKNGIFDTRMILSPHYEAASLYFKHGKEWLKNNYKQTDYFKMKTCFQNYKEVDIDRFMVLCESVKNGYLTGKYENSYPIILEKPFASTRYNLEVPIQGYEVFSGHHRIGILLALGRNDSVVAIGEDADPGSCFTNGKIHKLCIKES